MMSRPTSRGGLVAPATINSTVSSASSRGSCVGQPASPSASATCTASSAKIWSSASGLVTGSASTCPGTEPTAPKNVMPFAAIRVS